jgi:hypothetical protein
MYTKDFALPDFVANRALQRRLPLDGIELWYEITQT